MRALRPAAIYYYTDVWNTLMVEVAGIGNVLLVSPSCCHEPVAHSLPFLTVAQFF